MTRLYLRNNLDITSNLPTSEQSSLTSVQNAISQTNNLGMFTNKGIVATNCNIASFAFTVAIKEVYIGRWVYSLDGVSSISANTWTLLHCSGTGNNIHKYALDTNKKIYINLYVWRPGTGKVATVFEGDSNATTASIPHTAAIYRNTFSGSSVGSIQNTDFLVLELWSHTSTSSAGNQIAMFYYNGTDDTSSDGTSSTNAAAYLETPQTLPTREYVQQRLYFHDALSDVSGTLPSSEQSSLTPSVNVDAQTVNRSMNDTIGTSQTSKQWNINDGSSAAVYYITRFVSPPLAAQTIPASDWSYSFAAAESATSVNYPTGTVHICLYTWNPTTGSKGSDILIGNSVSGFAEVSATNSERSQFGVFPGAEVTIQAGEVLCIEVIFNIDPTSGSGRTATYYYDGTTETFSTNTVVSNHASFLVPPVNIDFSLLRNLERTISESITITHTSTGLLRNKIKRFESILGQDNFDAGTYSFTEGGLSPNSKWDNQYLGGTGSSSGVRASASAGNNVMWLVPQASVGEFETHATFNLFIENQFADFDITVDLKTVQQLRTGFTPYAWETAWILFRYTDNWHHYYLVLKTSGIELGRKDYATEIEQQIFLVTNGTPTVSLGNWQNLRIRAVKNKFTVWVNGVFAFDFVDDGSVGYDTNTGGLPAPPSAAMYNGYIGLYTEDAEVEFNNFTVSEVPILTFVDTTTKTKGRVRDTGTQALTISETINRLRNKQRTRSDSITITHTSTNRSRMLIQLRTDTLTLVHTSTNRLRLLFALISDSLTLTHTSTNRLRSFLQVFSDSITFSESINRIRGLVMLISDSIGLSELNSRLRNKIYTLSELMGLSDDLSRISTRIRTVLADLSFNETIYRLIHRPVSFDDSISFSESIERSKSVLRSLSYSITFSDTVLGLRGFARLVSDSLGEFTDNFDRLRELSRQLESDIQIQDSFQYLRNKVKTLPYALTFSSTLEKLTTRIREFTQNLNLTDLIETAGASKIRNVIDSLDFASSVLKSRNKIRSYSDSFSLIDDLSLQRLKQRLLQESMVLQDNITTQTTRIRIFIDNLSFTDLIENGVAFTKGFTENIQWTENIQKMSTRTRVISESLGLSDSLSRLKLKLRTLSDTMTLSDIVSQSKEFVKTISESISFSSQYNRSLHLLKSLSDSLSLNSGLTRLKTILRSISETISLTDSFIQQSFSALIKTISEELSLSDGAQRVKGQLKTFTDTLSVISDTIKSRPYRIKIISENLTFSHNTNRLRILIFRGFDQNIAFSSNVFRVVKGAVKSFKLKIRRFKLYRYS